MFVANKQTETDVIETYINDYKMEKIQKEMNDLSRIYLHHENQMEYQDLIESFSKLSTE